MTQTGPRVRHGIRVTTLTIHREHEPEEGTHSHQTEPHGPLPACHLPRGGNPKDLRLLSPTFAATSIMTIDYKRFRSPKPKEISPVGPLLLMCLLLPYPALGTELKRDPTRSYATPWKLLTANWNTGNFFCL